MPELGTYFPHSLMLDFKHWDCLESDTRELLASSASGWYRDQEDNFEYFFSEDRFMAFWQVMHQLHQKDISYRHFFFGKTGV